MAKAPAKTETEVTPEVTDEAIINAAEAASEEVTPEVTEEDLLPASTRAEIEAGRAALAKAAASAAAE